MATEVQFLITLTVEDADAMDKPAVQNALHSAIDKRYNEVGLTEWDNAALVTGYKVQEVENTGPKSWRGLLAQLYIDWHNNYLSAEKFGEHNGLSKEHAEALVSLAREVYNSKHPDA